MFARAGGCCEACGAIVGRIPYSIHHRQPRGMGGSRDPAANSPTNLLLLCGTGTTGCHGEAESNRTAARARGVLVPRGTDPAAVPVLLHDTQWVYLNDAGGYTPVSMGA